MAKKQDSSLGEAVEELFQQRLDEGLKCITMLPVSYECEEDKGRALTSHVRASWADAFLIALARHGTFLAATRLAGVARQTVYDLINTSPEFARAVDTAKHEFAELLEAVAIHRAMHGSERLLEFLMKGAMPGKYKEQHANVTVNTAPIVIDIVSEGAREADFASEMPALDASIGGFEPSGTYPQI